MNNNTHNSIDYRITRSKTPSVFSNSEDEDDDSVVFSYSSFNSDTQVNSPQRRTSSMSNEQAKAIIFSAYTANHKHQRQLSTHISEPEINEKLYHIRLTTDDDSFTTILKKDENATVSQLIEMLQKKYNFGDIMISLEDGDEVARHLNHYDKIIKIQNRIMRMNGVDEEDLPNACLGKDKSFKFLIHRL